MKKAVISIVNGAIGTIPKRFRKEAGIDIGQHFEIGKNTEKCPRDLRRLVTQTPMKDHQLTLA